MTVDEEKIQQLVKAVLDAVDARLDTIRHDLAQFSADVERRHHETIIAVAALERRVDHLEQLGADQAATAGPVKDRLMNLQERVDALESAAARTPKEPATEPPAADYSTLSRPLYQGPITSQLPEVTDPAIHELVAPPIPPAVPPTMGPSAHGTGHPLPTPPMFRTVEPTTRETALTATAQPAAPAPAQPTTAAAPTDDTGEIDVEQLTRILDEKLSHLHLPIHDEP